MINITSNVLNKKSQILKLNFYLDVPVPRILPFLQESPQIYTARSEAGYMYYRRLQGCTLMACIIM